MDRRGKEGQRILTRLSQGCSDVWTTGLPSPRGATAWRWLPSLTSARAVVARFRFVSILRRHQPVRHQDAGPSPWSDFISDSQRLCPCSFDGDAEAFARCGTGRPTANSTSGPGCTPSTRHRRALSWPDRRGFRRRNRRRSIGSCRAHSCVLRDCRAGG